MELFDSWRQRRADNQAAMDAQLQRQRDALAADFSVREAQIRQDTIRQMQAIMEEHVVEIVNKTGGLGDSSAAVANKTSLMVCCNTVTMSPWTHKEENHLQEVKASYQYVLALYLKKRLTQVRDNIQASDFPEYVSLDQQEVTSARHHDDQLKNILKGTGLKRLADKYSESAQPSLADSQVIRCKQDCEKLITSLDRMIDTQFLYLKGKKTPELNVQLDSRVLAFIFGDNSGANPALAPRA